MARFRSLIAWTLYSLGHAVYVVFDQWLPWGMNALIYGAYNRLMTTSAAVQGPGDNGPWSAELHGEPEHTP